MQKEEQGIIKMINTVKGFGFIALKMRSDIYFQLKDLQDLNLEIGDEVQFVAGNRRGNIYASAIRKVYENSKGMKFVNRINSHLHDDIQMLMPDVIEKITDVHDDFCVKEVEFNRVIGKTICVCTNEDDSVVYAIRKGRFGHTRFVKNATSEDCKKVTIVLKRISCGTMLIMSCFIGRKAEVEPFDERATESSLQFWKSHALIWEGEEIIAGSEVKENPWLLGCKAISKCKRRYYDRRRVA